MQCCYRCLSLLFLASIAACLHFQIHLGSHMPTIKSILFAGLISSEVSFAAMPRKTLSRRRTKWYTQRKRVFGGGGITTTGQHRCYPSTTFASTSFGATLESALSTSTVASASVSPAVSVVR